MQPSRKGYGPFVRLPLYGAILVLIVMGIFSRRGGLDWWRMQEKNASLEREMESLRTQKAELNTRIARFKESREEQRRVIRHRLGYVSKDELVIEFE